MANKKIFETTKWDVNKVRSKGENTQQSAQSAPQQVSPRKPRKKKKFNVPRYIACVLLISCLLAGLGWLLANDLCSLSKEYTEATIVVEEDDSVGDVAKKLKDAGLINFKSFFCFTGIFLHAKDTIDPGTYKELTSDMDYRCLIHSLHDYEQDEMDDAGIVQVTIPEGYTVQQIIDLLAKNGVATKEDLTDAAANYEFQDYDFLDSGKKGNPNRMEGFLFPDTYQFYTDKSAVLAFDTMLTGFVNQISDEMKADMEKSGKSLHDIVTMASIIEKEGIGDAKERKNIASVLYNRLKSSNQETYGYLQLDTTIYYALSLEGKDKTDFDKDMDSPYNTYLHDGLPVGPICNPGLNSIKAAIYPNNTDYYYFAAGKDGVNHFNKTFSEHDEFVHSDMYQPD
ncbi:MAG: endolytic transglycosylase MltG [Clostridiales bacterium]|nr:endolytic transglycosylase MltG [Candidatus Cacconaster stercorequi]